MLPKLTWRFLTEISPRLLWKAAWLWGRQGLRAMAAHQKRLRRGEYFPPFWFLDLTNACNLRCRGCWVEKDGPVYNLTDGELDALIAVCRKQDARFFILMGGEPFMHPNLFGVLERNRDCWFQIITNGMFLSAENVARLRRAGNATPLISLDGSPERNDQRRGAGVYAAIVEGLARLKNAGLLFGVAVTVDARNAAEVLSDAFVEDLISRGAHYVWYYIYRPFGATPAPECALSAAQILDVRRRLLALRRRQPILVVDSYWDADGRAFCPAAMGLGHHVGPRGGVEICPPLHFAAQTIRDNDGDFFKTINESKLLRAFPEFVAKRTKGCVILEDPQALKAWLQSHGAADYSGRDGWTELGALPQLPSHHQPGAEIPEDYWLYRFLKKRLFFGMGSYG
jgi:MoaA/NifB/PqqE/SkfB family radical SAM enzyme